MDSFVSRKRRRLSPPPTTSLVPSTDEISALSAADDDSTDFKLGLLSSLHPYIEQAVLLDVLLAYEGSVERASASLTTSNSPRRKSPSVIGYQSSLAAFVAGDQGQSPSKKTKLLSQKGKTLHLYTPEDVAANTPCSIIHNFLPSDNANALLKELLQEASTYERTTFKLFDNVVSSPHTACFYVDSYEDMRKQKTEYIYNGGLLSDIRHLTPQLRSVSPYVEKAVNAEITKRITTHYDGRKLKFQSANSWQPNAAFVNCYDGAAESVGYHSDQLTYLGPRAVIGSISLGVAREFRVRRVIPQDGAKNEKSKEDSDAAGQIAIHLPHNSLLVMHAEMQEEWKHSIAPAQAIDPHPVAGNRRINITYRDYKASLHPKFTPKCRCDVPTVLRVVQRKKENWGKYFWMCHAGNVPGKEGCTFFEWAHFDDDGEPVWKHEHATEHKVFSKTARTSDIIHDGKK